jgi:hypothetical protein
MEGLHEIEAIESYRDLPVGGSADPEARREVVRRQSGEPRNHTEEVLPDLRPRRQFLRRQRGGRRADGVADPEATGRDDDFGKTNGRLPLRARGAVGQDHAQQDQRKKPGGAHAVHQSRTLEPAAPCFNQRPTTVVAAPSWLDSSRSPATGSPPHTVLTASRPAFVTF